MALTPERNSDFGFPCTNPSKGGYQDEQLNEAQAQSMANSMIVANDAAAGAMAGASPNAPGGPYSGVSKDS